MTYGEECVDGQQKMKEGKRNIYFFHDIALGIGHS